METVVLQTLRKVRHLEVGSLVKLSEVNEELMRNTPVAVLVPQDVVPGEAMRHVIGVQERCGGGSREAIAAEHLDVRPGDQEDRCATVLCGGDSVDGFVTTSGHNRVGWEERREVFSHTDGPKVL